MAVCTRDRADLLAACLDGLLAQARPGEILVVDNAPSDDRTAALAARLGVGHVTEPCPGLDFARNRALRVATGQLVAFVDDLEGTGFSRPDRVVQLDLPWDVRLSAPVPPVGG